MNYQLHFVNSVGMHKALETPFATLEQAMTTACPLYGMVEKMICDASNHVFRRGFATFVNDCSFMLQGIGGKSGARGACRMKAKTPLTPRCFDALGTIRKQRYCCT
jgi:hypothetical protein